ncbi:MAG: hypothetical protein K8S62_11915 [Candidatus Sabulitectum sp.]|nr:hypothetical protein [Candidatus Sabulitectum sp.]
METVEGKNIKDLFEKIIGIYTDTSRLLVDAEALMKERGFENIGSGNSISTEQSKVKTNVHLWVTPYAVMYFAEEESATSPIYGLGVFFMGPADMKKPIEPLVIFGCLNLKIDEEGSRKRPLPWYLKEAWFSMTENREIGKLHKVSEKFEIKNGVIQALHIEDISDFDSLQSKIIEPLLEMSID